MFYMSVCPFVALSKAIRMPKIRTFICLVVINKAFIFNLLCVLISKLDLPREGAFHLRSSTSDTERSVFPISSFISVCPFVTLPKATYAENSHHIILSSRY